MLSRFSVAVTLTLALLARPVRALPGSHAPAISTYDTRASSVVIAYRHGESDAGPFNTYSYNANFSSTTGKLSAQFGIHYLNFASTEGDSKAHGVGASGVALFVFPVAGRYDDGVPKAALAFDVGVVPSAYISGQRNFLTLPLVLGFGIPLSPAPVLTITPWYELAPGVNLDTVFQPANITVDPNSVTIDPTTHNVSLSSGAVEAAAEKGVAIDFRLSVPMRAGLDVAFHLGPSVDLNLYGSASTLGGAFSGAAVYGLGAGLVFRWDDIVSAVLPVERRLDREGCDAIEGRFRSCPNSERWLSPERRARMNGEPLPAAPLNGAPPLNSAPLPAPPPAAPPPAPAPATSARAPAPVTFAPPVAAARPPLFAPAPAATPAPAPAGPPSASFPN